MRPTLFDFAGGAPAFLALAAAHHARCLQDPELNHPFSHPDQHPHHVERLAAYWAEVLGWPPRYSQEWGDHSGVLLMHAGNGTWATWASGFHLLRRHGRRCRPARRPRVPLGVARPHALGGRRGAGLLAEDASVPQGAAMPHWSWDGLQASRTR